MESEYDFNKRVAKNLEMTVYIVVIERNGLKTSFGLAKNIDQMANNVIQQYCCNDIEDILSIDEVKDE